MANASRLQTLLLQQYQIAANHRDAQPVDEASAPFYPVCHLTFCAGLDATEESHRLRRH